MLSQHSTAGMEDLVYFEREKKKEKEAEGHHDEGRHHGLEVTAERMTHERDDKLICLVMFGVLNLCEFEGTEPSIHFQQSLASLSVEFSN